MGRLRLERKKRRFRSHGCFVRLCGKEGPRKEPDKIQGSIFWENDTTITANYTVTANKNAGTFGPVTINNGVTVTVPNDSTWSIV